MLRTSIFSRAYLLIAPLAIAAGCSDPGPTDVATEQDTVGAIEAELEAPADDTVASKDFRHHGRGGPRAHRGPFGLFHEALQLDDLSAEQRSSIESLVAALHPDREKSDEAPRAMGAAIASGVRAGKIDTAALSSSGSRLKEHFKRYEEALTKLHDTLTPAQRAKVVESVRPRVDKGGVADEPGMRTGGLRRMHRFSRFGKHDPSERMAEELGLTDAQKQAWDAAKQSAGIQKSADAFKARFAEMRKKHETLLDAFVTDDFDAAALSAPAGAKFPGAERLTSLNVLLPILTDDQRGALADRIEAGPFARHHR